MLDIKIRTSSKGTKSLDDVMRRLNSEFAKKGRNFTPEDYQKVCEMMSGVSLNDFFDKYVRGRDEIEYNEILNPIGLKLVNLASESDEGYFGANLSNFGDQLTILSIPSDTPAYKSGLNARDQIVKIDGHRASLEFLRSHLSKKKAGEKVKFTISRFDKLQEIYVTLGRTPASEYKIVPRENPTAEQKRLYDGYLGMK